MVLVPLDISYWTLDGELEEAEYCTWIDCSHAGKKIAGCHDFGDFFQPTCETCRRLYPRACAPKVYPQRIKTSSYCRQFTLTSFLSVEDTDIRMLNSEHHIHKVTRMSDDAIDIRVMISCYDCTIV